jgi:hypothetical protein
MISKDTNLFFLCYEAFWKLNSEGMFQVEQKALFHFGLRSATFLEPLIETCVIGLKCTMIQTTGGHVWWVSVLFCSVLFCSVLFCSVMRFQWRRSQELLEILGLVDDVHFLYFFVYVKLRTSLRRKIQGYGFTGWSVQLFDNHLHFFLIKFLLNGRNNWDKVQLQHVLTV